MTRLQADLLLTFVAIIWGSAFVFQAHGMQHLGPMAFTGVRFLLGALVVLPLALWEAPRRRPESRQRPMAPTLLLLGSLMAVGAAFQQIGIVTTSVTNAGFLTALYVPLVPVLGALLLKESPHWSVWPCALACVAGAYLLSGVQTLQLHVGDAWVIASVFPWALHVLLVGRMADKFDAPFAIASGQFAVVGALCLAYAFLFEPFTWAQVQAAAIPIAYTGMLSAGVAFTAQVVAQRTAPASDAAIILSSETLFAAGFGYWLLGERLNTQGLLGCALILAALLAVQLLPLLHPALKRKTA
ncbi:drug/metabolite transporter (DMT)-like permease [Inhella inkyongensis]|uniref:Drug/metabolite transporter (DMT)-like permease n=1 Tax=Inhella inkyongensis TaxID=392593 RepID=A0A840S4V8_9BURK|nr:DMT family transporter [Inhella inkyongensis]MBB5204066.1 drug/metabolite transporter (DMT)-like permease [Inhella inkyongensis]